MNSSDLMRLLEKNGWKLKRIKGSHHQFTHLEFSVVITVPHPRRDIKRGTLNKILKDAKIK
ncbi:type II toxin-antitoxin system HicA family toxin [Xenorhabdus doucetiae]|uniref:type II toxin-antitoxin system HicA family toxin n=1 Tax=Xenorhabdus doucetiae TaxID=351671 RepID=UPI0005FA42B5|nr:MULTISPECIES: type II toxin-antitoxin system HicA family toxin [Xenorhabdus]MBD2784030.1 type II toxin-antitoxin system HicA family toxin [Xenorhabdus sp. 3]MBD2787845.1 type II toxin-antitoxin system HicA family toxin [Xenorhabdus sp. DI]MBD2795349.1 type II toxin-antitoxin system HicA family toxin [Xenorhabdus sp. 18]